MGKIYNTMTKYIVISGIDGSGKTSVIESLQRKLEEDGIKVSYIWMRYNHYLLKCMNALARIMRLSVKVHNEMGEVWEHRLYKNRAFCKVYIWCSYIDNMIAKKKVYREKADIVICDRWVNDILIDLGAECRFNKILESKWFARFQAMLPQGTKQFVIQRNVEDLLACRIENNTNPDFKYRLELYQKLAKKEYIIAIDNTGTIANSVEQILKYLS